MSDEPFSCSECHADFGHALRCSRRVLDKPIGCAECGLLGGHARGCSSALPDPLTEAKARLVAAQARLPRIGSDVPVLNGAPGGGGSSGRGLRALIPYEPLPADVASQAVVDQVIASLIAEDARARSCLPASPAGWHWDASLEARPNGEGAQAEVRVRIAYRLMED